MTLFATKSWMTCNLKFKKYNVKCIINKICVTELTVKFKMYSVLIIEIYDVNK